MGGGGDGPGWGVGWGCEGPGWGGRLVGGGAGVSEFSSPMNQKK